MGMFTTPETIGDVVTMLGRLYADELIAELQYWNHYYAVSGPFAGQLQAMLKEHAKEEQGHREALGEMIHMLGGEPPACLHAIMARATSAVPDVRCLSEASIDSYPGAELPALRALLQTVSLNLPAEEDAKRAYQEAAQLIRPLHEAAADLCVAHLRDETHHAHELRNLLL